jgi:hypothetical protein
VTGHESEADSRIPCSPLRVRLLIECLTFWRWSQWFWTPVQAHYMAPYVWSALPGVSPASTLRVGWIWKTAPGGKREFALEDDAVRGPSSDQEKLGMILSQSSREAGWTGLVEGPREPVSAARMRPILAAQIFEGQSVWIFVVLPGMIGFVAAIFLLQCLVWLEDWLPELPWQRHRLPWENPVPNIWERGKVWIQRIPSIAIRSHGPATQKRTTHLPDSTIASQERHAPENLKGLAIPFSRVPDGASRRAYV